MRKIYNCTVIAFLLIAGGCSLNIELEDEIAGLDAIDDVAVAREALHSVYYSYPKSNMELSLLAEDFFPTALVKYDPALLKLYKWSDEEMVELSNSLWDAYYTALANLNILLSSEKYIRQETSYDRTEWETIKGEAYGLKAFIYLDLMSLYSKRYSPENTGIVLKDDIKDELVPREKAGKCMEEIDSLLLKSRRLLADKEYDAGKYYYLNYDAVLLLSARAALYQGDIESATSFCEELISQRGYSSESPNINDYMNLWKNVRSEEKLFAFFNEKQMNLSGYTYNSTMGDVIATTDVFNYEEHDVRYGVATLPFVMKKADGVTSVTYCLMGKYRSAIDDYEYVNINSLRLAEAYFILGECMLQREEYGPARETVNKVLARRGAALIPGNITGSALVERMFIEKQREFVGEGLNFFDLKRSGREMRRFRTDNSSGLVENSIKTDDYHWALPIPLSERRGNKAAEQNPGWQDVMVN